MRITRAKRKPPAFCREVRTGFCGLFGKITAFSAKMILKRTVLWYTFCAKPLILVDRIVALRCRSPCGERGLKCLTRKNGRERRWSLPVRGAWVEIEMRRLRCPGRLCRSPCGERGLKSAAPAARLSAGGSLPVRGAWVEICGGCCYGRARSVAPRAGSVG